MKVITTIGKIIGGAIVGGLFLPYLLAFNGLFTGMPMSYGPIVMAIGAAIGIFTALTSEI